jgi:mannose-6-phosphate isomerase-like protein (cupin superfamily)
MFETKLVPNEPDAVAPDGSMVRILASLNSGGLAHFELAPGETSIAVHHRTVEEIWYFIGGEGLIWRSTDTNGEDEPIPARAGVSVTIPLGTHFQFHSIGPDPLQVIGVTIPPWPGYGEAIRSGGYWTPTVAPGPGLAES